jgi:hypothetical protein
MSLTTGRNVQPFFCAKCKRVKKPGQTQIKKIEKAFHELAVELSAVEL